MTGVDVEHTKARLSDLRTQLDVCKVHRITPGPSSMESAISIAEGLVAAVERVQAQVDKTLEILDRYNHSDDGDLPECAPEDRWRLYRDLLATLNPEALETP